MADISNPSDAEDTAENVTQRLIDEFGASLDESLIRAIASDHDIPTSYNQIRNLLLQLAETAPAEEATGFDPSGLSSLPDLAGLRFDDATTEDTGLVSQSSTTEVTVASSSDLSDGLEPSRFSHKADLSEDEQIAGLQMIFSNFREHTIKFVLRQAGGDIERAFDELLNRQFLAENGELAKGVEGFYEPDKEPRPKKCERVTQQKSKTAKLQVDYSVTLDLPDVDELEGAKGSVKLQPQSAAKSSKRVTRPVAARPSIPTPLPMTRQSPAQRPNGNLGQKVQKINTPKPAASEWQVVTRKQKSIKPPTAAPAVVGASASSNAQTAAALYRKGASNPLYRQAVSVYSERAREDLRAAQEAASESYERLVDSQSTAFKIDLHGVPVIEGVRIAKNRVWQWWEGLELEDRRRKAQIQGFTVVTGLGNHSTGGVSRLQQAVRLALKNDGWKVEEFSGQFFIKGRT